MRKKQNTGAAATATNKIAKLIQIKTNKLFGRVSRAID